MTSSASDRSCAPLTEAHLAHLSDIAEEDHRYFTRQGGRAEYRNRRVAVVLAQGGALHFLDGTTGVKDLDVWTFYAAIPGVDFPFGQRKRHVDFGPSDHGRNLYPPGFTHRQLARWQRFKGRKVDLMVRSLPVQPDSSSRVVVDAMRTWLRDGQATPLKASEDDMPSNWWLAKKAMVMIDPPGDRESVVWPTS